jgi:hypothetical protein
MRSDREAFREFVHGYPWRLHETAEWGGRQYVVTGSIKLVDGLQRLEVIDITDTPAALFSLAWPEQTGGRRSHALVHHSDEGHDVILMEDGRKMWVTYADLPIRVVAGGKGDLSEVRRQQIDEYEASIDG